MKKLTSISMLLLFTLFVLSKSMNAGISDKNLPTINSPYANNPFEYVDDQMDFDISMQGIKNVFPFPAKDYINIDGVYTGTLEIINFQGIVLKSVIIDCPVAVISISDLPDGVYNVRIVTDEGNELWKMSKQ